MISSSDLGAILEMMAKPASAGDLAKNRPSAKASAIVHCCQILT